MDIKVYKSVVIAIYKTHTKPPIAIAKKLSGFIFLESPKQGKFNKILTIENAQIAYLWTYSMKDFVCLNE